MPYFQAYFVFLWRQGFIHFEVRFENNFDVHVWAIIPGHLAAKGVV